MTRQKAESLSVERNGNSLTVRYAGKKSPNGWVSGGVLCHVVTLPGGVLLSSMTDKPIRIFHEGGELDAIRHAVFFSLPMEFQELADNLTL